MTLAEQAKKAGMSEDEIQTLAEGEAELSGQTVAEPSADAPVVEAVADVPATPESGGAEAPAVDDPENPDAAAELVADAPVETMPVPTIPENADARLVEIRSELKAARTNAFSGEMTPEEYSDLEDKLSAERDVILDARRSADYAQRYNQQRQAEYVTDTRTGAFKEFKAEGVDYATKDLRAKFDRAFGVLMSDPEFADKPLTELGSVYAEAHKMVKAMIGFQPKAPAKPAVAAAPVTPRQAPVTLGGLPAAAPASVQDETLQKMNQLNGEDLERFYASLPKAEVTRLMKLAS